MTVKGSGDDPRRIRLSQVDAKPKNYRDCCMVIPFDSYQARCPHRASKLIGTVSKAHGETHTISSLMLLNHDQHEGDVILVPTTEESEDNLKVEWSEAGKQATIDVLKLLAYKKITIPEGSNMVVEMVAEDDKVFEKVIRLKLVDAQFEPKKEGTPRKKNPQTAPGTGTQTNPGTQANAGGQNTAAGQMGQTPPTDKPEQK